MSSASALVFTLIITLACLAMFAAAPGLDLIVARHFFAAGRFIGHGPADEILRRIYYDGPYILLALLLAAYVARRAGYLRRGPSGRSVVFMVASLALGPGLLVNAVLKEVSHRPRPGQTLQFGGAWRFRPYESFDGDCGKNCSFVSGEVSTSAWTLAPALLAPPALKPFAIGAALFFTAATGWLRMEFGGHYLSDVTLAALFTFLIVLALYRWYLRRPEPQ